MVVQTALAGMLALARRLPRLMEAQRRREWAPLIGAALPRDLAGQTALVVGWGPIGQGIAAPAAARSASASWSRAAAARRPARTSRRLATRRSTELLPRADWLMLACPLIVANDAASSMPLGTACCRQARTSSTSRAARSSTRWRCSTRWRAAGSRGAHLDVFAHEPLASDSPLWSAANVIVTPHSAGHSDGNEERVRAAFLANLRRWLAGDALLHEVAPLSSP